MTNYLIHYSTPLHRKVLDAILIRKSAAERAMATPITKFTDAENSFLAYAPTTEADLARKNKRREGKSQYTTIVLPYTYAMTMTAHTYLSTVFLGRSPVYQFTGRHGETENAVQGVEAIMDYQMNVGNMLMPHYIWLMDALKYGIGAMSSYWDTETSVVSRITEEPRTMFGLELPGTVKKRTTTRITGYTGNKLYNIRPHDLLPDGRVPVGELNRGEFFGHKLRVGWHTILEGAQTKRYFNVDTLERMRANPDKDFSAGSPALTLPEQNEQTIQTPDGMKDVGRIDLIDMTIKLVPKDWGLGQSAAPEKWRFVVANSAVIISAAPLGLYHDKFPYHILQPEFDGYSFITRSPQEVIQPLAEVMSWLLNSHFYNVRATLNNQFLFDPTMVEIEDLLDPEAGLMIRTTPQAAGRDVRSLLAQLPVADVTRGNIADMQVVAEVAQLVLGINQNIMGAVNTGGRKTATEIRASSTFGINRMKGLAEFLSAQGFGPLGQVLLQNTQQFLDQELQLKVAGPLVQRGKQWLNVTPQAISGFYDFVPVDGTMPIDRIALANTWRELLVQASKIPGVLQRYDMAKIFEYVAELGGAKNVDQFRIEVQPDGAVAAGAQAGNLVPMGGMNGEAPVSFNGGQPAGVGGFPPPAQVSGMGPLG